MLKKKLFIGWGRDLGVGWGRWNYPDLEARWVGWGYFEKTTEFEQRNGKEF